MSVDGPDHIAECVTCTWAASTTGTNYGEEKIKTLAHAHYRTCEGHTDCVLLKQRTWDDKAQQPTEEVVGQVNNDGIGSTDGVSV